MGMKDDYIIRKLDSLEAQQMVIKNHYLHRQAPCTYSYGLFKNEYTNIFGEKDGALVGVIIYGSPASPSLCNGICGKDEKDNVIELTRLWIDDSVGKNAESFLIGNTIKLLPKEIIVSFADPTTEKRHVGYVYQATNWLYTGLSADRTDRKIRGDNRHSKSISNMYSAEQMKSKFKEETYLESRPRKHRYVYFNCNKKRKKELLAKLKYGIKPYPKNNA